MRAMAVHASSKLKYILHAIQARRPAYEPCGRLQCAARKDQAIGSPVSDFQALAGRGEGHRVFAHDVARPQHRKADSGWVTGGAHAMAAEDPDIAQTLAA